MTELGREMAGIALRVARTSCSEDREFTLRGRQWHQLAGVVGSEYNVATGLFAGWLPLAGARSMLEMGSGCGVAAVTAALAGCSEVLAVDINPNAVETTRLNAARHGVADRVTCLRSDLFSAVPSGAGFDVVFWNSPFIDDIVARTGDQDYFVDHFFDPGYALHDRFCAALAGHLSPRGRAFLGLSRAMGDVAEVERIAARHDLALRPFRSESFQVPYEEIGATEVLRRAADANGSIAVDFTLLELVR